MQMILSLSVVSCFFLGNFGIQGTIRADFHEKEPDEQRLETIINEKGYEDSPLTAAYKGLCETMMAKYAFMPTSKLRYFNNGKSKIESAIRAQKDNPELRYIRLMVQLNAPALLGYYGQVSGDIDFFINGVQNYGIDKKWIVLFTDNLLRGENLKPEDKVKLLGFKKAFDEKPFFKQV